MFKFCLEEMSAFFDEAEMSKPEWSMSTWERRGQLGGIFEVYFSRIEIDCRVKVDTGGGVERVSDGEWGETWMVYYLYPQIGVVREKDEFQRHSKV